MLTLQEKQPVLFLQDIHIDISRAILTLLFSIFGGNLYEEESVSYDVPVR